MLIFLSKYKVIIISQSSSNETSTPVAKKCQRPFTIACKTNAIDLHDKFDLSKASKLTSVPIRYTSEWVSKRQTIEDVTSFSKRRVQNSPDIKLGCPMKHKILEEKVRFLNVF